MLLRSARATARCNAGTDQSSVIAPFTEDQLTFALRCSFKKAALSTHPDRADPGAKEAAEAAFNEAAAGPIYIGVAVVEPSLMLI